MFFDLHSHYTAFLQTHFSTQSNCFRNTSKAHSLCSLHSSLNPPTIVDALTVVPAIRSVKQETAIALFQYLSQGTLSLFLNITLWLQPVPTILYFLGDATTYNNVYNRKVDILACDMNILGN